MIHKAFCHCNRGLKREVNLKCKTGAITRGGGGLCPGPLKMRGGGGGGGLCLFPT